MTQTRNQDLAQRMAELARAAAAPRSVEDVLTDVTGAAMELIPGADTAGVLLIGKGGKFESVANTSDLPHRLDELQMMFNEGPCVEAALDELIVRTDDFRSEERWPQYAAAVVEIGVLSGLSFKLYTADRTAGALNLNANSTVSVTTDGTGMSAVSDGRMSFVSPSTISPSTWRASRVWM